MKKRSAAVMIAVIAFFLSACKSPISPEETASKALDAVKSLDRDTASKYIDDYDRLMNYSEGDNLYLNDETARLLLKNFSYKILSCDTDGDKATVRAEITNLDLKPVFSEYVKQAVQLILDDALSKKDQAGHEEALKEKLQSAFNSLLEKQSQTATATVDIALAKSKSGFVVRADDALQDAVFGGLAGAIRAMVAQGEAPAGASRAGTDAGSTAAPQAAGEGTGTSSAQTAAGTDAGMSAGQAASGTANGK